MPECKNCFDGCTIKTFDKCIRYTGEDVEDLDICNGDPLNEVLEDIITRLLSYTDGSGITVQLTSPCTAVSNKLASDYTLANILQAFSDLICEHEEEIDDINDVVNTPYSFNTSCLTLGANPTKDDILQATITKTCANTTAIATILADYVKASQLNTLIQQYLDAIDDGSTSIQQNSKMVPYVAYEYYGPMSNFDSSGKGLSASGYEKVYVCNGSNGTPDKRGRVAVGANVGVPGGAMDSAVDPAVAGNYQVTTKGKLGSFKHTLTLTETAAHTHATSTQVVNLNLPGQIGGDNDDHNNKSRFAAGDKGYDTPGSFFTLPYSFSLPASTTGAAGGGQSHNNTQPSIGAVYIMYIP